jgi:hypothetical protein
MRQLKIFAYSILTLAAITAFPMITTSQNVHQTPLDCEECCDRKFMVVQKTESKEVHLIYDFKLGTVSIVNIRKDYNEPIVNSYTKKLSQ